MMHAIEYLLLSAWPQVLAPGIPPFLSEGDVFPSRTKEALNDHAHLAVSPAHCSFTDDHLGIPMKTVRFSKVVEKSGRPEVYLLMSETDPDFRKALNAGKIMGLSGESHGAGTEYGTVGYDKKSHGQLLIFPKPLKAFVGSKIVGIKYDFLSEDSGNRDEKPSRRKEATKPKEKPFKRPLPAKPPPKKKQKKTEPKPARKLIPFPAPKKERANAKTHDSKTQIRQAMRALEKGNSVAAYNILKQIVSAS
jgi:hypothetical protein